MAGVLDFDLSPSWCGWCAGDGSGTPTAGAFTLPGLITDFGVISETFRLQFVSLVERFEPEAVGFEKPILKPHDTLLKLRIIYGIEFFLEGLCAMPEFALPCGEIDLRLIKNMMTGNPFAEKVDVAKAAEGLGIDLPLADCGRLDAGDASGAWLVHLSEFDPPAASPWIARLRGSLL